MRDLLITNSSGITIGSDELPIIIKMGQYDKGIATKASGKAASFFDSINTGVMGNFGNGNFDFGIDCRHYPLTNNEETDSFKFINTTLAEKVYPVFNKSYLEEKFIILTINDYGQ